MKNYKKVYAALILAGGLILHGCNGIFDDLAINPCNIKPPAKINAAYTFL